MLKLARLAGAMNKKRISIDQCFLSNMCKGDAKSQDLFDVLKKAHTAGKIICPIHLEESIFESSFLSSDLRDKIFALQNLLSDGFSFHSLTHQFCYQTSALIRPGIMYPMIRSVGLTTIPATDFAALAIKHKAGKEDYIDRLNKTPYPPPSYKKGMKGDEIMKFISKERAASMYRILQAIKITGTLDTGMEEWELALEVGAFLLKIKISSEDCGILMQKVLNHQWEGIPYLWLHSRINAQIELGYLSGLKKANANDLLDLSRIAVGLNDAATVLCDTPMAEMIKQSKVLDTIQGVRVFSMQQQDEAAVYVERM
jgi:hypothetical protein